MIQRNRDDENHTINTNKVYSLLNKMPCVDCLWIQVSATNQQQIIVKIQCLVQDLCVTLL